jgi:flagellar biosynthesis/type III secretory pathway protein FliH
MRASWCWLEAAMALFDGATGKTASWSTDPLLNTSQQTPRFLRTQWDEASARQFGPWRVAPKPDPADGLMTDTPDQAEVAIPTDPSAQEEPSPTPEVAPESASPWSESALAQMRDEAFQKGLREGQTQLRAEYEAERKKERELIRHLGIELRSISQDPQRFFEPLKRLSLHLAEQLVRAELQLSGHAISQLIQECIHQLDHPVEPVQVSVNPEDLLRLKAMGEAATQHLLLEADAQLRPGSVRVRVQDSVVQDLIEHRLEPLARRLLDQPEAWMQQSSLVKDQAQAMPADTPSREWNRQVIDVEDTEPKESSTGDGDNHD